jgi:predicted nuclease with TOPRIM domain
VSIKKQLIDFQAHCFETNQLQVGELISNAIKRIAELEKERDELKEVHSENNLLEDDLH